MSHHDYLYEPITIEKIENEINSANDWIIRLNKDKDLLGSDLASVSSDLSKELLTKEIKNFQYEIDRNWKVINRWNDVKRRILNGETITNTMAYDIVRGF